MDNIRLYFPGTAITLTNYICKTSPLSGSSVKFRPPGWVFALIWPFLYVLIGVTWWMSERDQEFSILIGLLCAWLVLYNCNEKKKLARNILIITTLFTYYLLYTFDKTERLTFAPLALWLTFATYLNYMEVRDVSSSLQTLDVHQVN